MTTEQNVDTRCGLITEDGAVTNKETEEFLRKYMAEFHGFIQRVYTVLPRNQ